MAGVSVHPLQTNAANWVLSVSCRFLFPMPVGWRGFLPQLEAARRVLWDKSGTFFMTFTRSGSQVQKQNSPGMS